jgi:hypothetical protein
MLDAKTGADGTSDTNQRRFSGLNHAHRRHQAAIFLESGDFGTSPFFGQHLVKLINSTVGQRIILVAQRLANSRPASSVDPWARQNNVWKSSEPCCSGGAACVSAYLTAEPTNLHHLLNRVFDAHHEGRRRTSPSRRPRVARTEPAGARPPRRA